MRLRKKVAALMAALIMATSVQTFAASTNGVNKIVTVKKGAHLEGTLAPEIRIQLKDTLEKGQAFYLVLENAQWIDDIEVQLEANKDFDFKRENKTKLVVEAKEDTIADTTPYRIPLFVKTTGGEATVEIISNDTVVTSGKYTFAIANETKSRVLVDDGKVFASVGEMAKITIEEEYIEAFKSNQTQIVTVELKNKGIEFNYNKGEVVQDAVIGKRAYQGKKYSAKIVDPTTLEVEIPANSLEASQKGSLEIQGIEIKATKDAIYGDIKAVVNGDLNETTELIVAKYGDYGTEVQVDKEYTAVAGQDLKDIEFTLSETVKDSLNGNRETIFTFLEGLTIESVSVIASKGLTKGATQPVPVIEKKDGKNTNRFNVASISADNDQLTAITFKATLRVPAAMKENIKLIVEGRSFEGTKEVAIAKVEAPVEVEVTPITAKVGFAQQQGGKIVISETDKGKLSPGKIFLAFDDMDIEYTKAPEVEVMEGNIRVDEKAKLVTGGIEVLINGKSTKASTIEIKGGEFKVNGLVPEGTYTVKVGGTAISSYSSDSLWNEDKKEHNEIDEVVEQDFMYLGTKPISNVSEFVIGKTTYTVNGIQKTMDTSPYLAKEGRTMLPVRYVADALGVQGNQILWDGESKTVTILVDGAIQIKLGNKEMVINGTKVPMTAAPQMKNDRVFIPVAEIARALGAGVDWDSVTQTATFK